MGTVSMTGNTSTSIISGTNTVIATNTAGTVDITADTSISLNVTAGNTEWENWDIDALVQSWLDGTFTNNGVVLKATDESSLDTIAVFRPSDYSSASYRPKLVIDYYIP